jgi:hypothetical protein
MALDPLCGDTCWVLNKLASVLSTATLDNVAYRGFIGSLIVELPKACEATVTKKLGQFEYYLRDRT